MVGLTGGIGSGKSSVARLLAGHGALIIDSDAIAREVVAPGTDGLAEIVAVFGEQMLTPAGELDRPRLGQVVFADPELLQRLNGITHPRIGARSAELIASAAPGQVIVHDIPLLVEAGVHASYDSVLVVEAPLDLRLSRLEARGLPREQAESRIAVQATDEQRRAVATYLIDNSGDLDALSARVDEVWAVLA